MVIAVAAVGVVQMTGDQVVEVVRVGHGLVAATGTVLVRTVMRAAGVAGGALVRVGSARGQAVLVHVIAMLVMQVPVVQIVRVTLVAHGAMAAAWGVGMGSVVLVLGAAHRRLLGPGASTTLVGGSSVLPRCQAAGERSSSALAAIVKYAAATNVR